MSGKMDNDAGLIKKIALSNEVSTHYKKVDNVLFLLRNGEPLFKEEMNYNEAKSYSSAMTAEQIMLICEKIELLDIKDTDSEITASKKRNLKSKLLKLIGCYKIK